MDNSATWRDRNAPKKCRICRSDGNSPNMIGPAVLEVLQSASRVWFSFRSGSYGTHHLLVHVLTWLIDCESSLVILADIMPGGQGEGERAAE